MLITLGEQLVASSIDKDYICLVLYRIQFRIVEQYSIFQGLKALRGFSSIDILVP